MNSNLKQNLTKVSNACNDGSFFVITNKYVVYEEKVYERREASWTESQLINDEESVLRKVGLNKNFEELSKLEAVNIENQRLSEELRKEIEELYEENESLRKEIEDSNANCEKLGLENEFLKKAIDDDVDELSDRIQNIEIHNVKKPVGRSVGQNQMAQAIKDLSVNLIHCVNKDADEKFKKNITWEDEYDSRIEALSEIISYTSEKVAGKNNLSVIYTNYRYLDFFKEKYDDENDFKREFLEATKKINDQTKAFKRYSRWSEAFKRLPPGSYLSCTIPNSYWRLIHKKEFDKIISSWDNNTL